MAEQRAYVEISECGDDQCYHLPEANYNKIRQVLCTAGFKLCIREGAERRIHVKVIQCPEAKFLRPGVDMPMVDQVDRYYLPDATCDETIEALLEAGFEARRAEEEVR